MEDPECSPQHVVMPVELMPGKTTAAPLLPDFAESSTDGTGH